TKTINSAADALKGNPKAKKFFDETATSLSYIGEVVVALGAALYHTFDPETVKALNEVIIKGLIPGLVLGIQMLTPITKLIAKAFGAPIVGDILKFAVALTVIRSSFGLLFLTMKGFLAPLGSIIDLIGQQAGAWDN